MTTADSNSSRVAAEAMLMTFRVLTQQEGASAVEAIRVNGELVVGGVSGAIGALADLGKPVSCRSRWDSGALAIDCLNIETTEQRGSHARAAEIAILALRSLLPVDHPVSERTTIVYKAGHESMLMSVGDYQRWMTEYKFAADFLWTPRGLNRDLPEAAVASVVLQSVPVPVKFNLSDP